MPLAATVSLPLSSCNCCPCAFLQPPTAGMPGGSLIALLADLGVPQPRPPVLPCLPACLPLLQACSDGSLIIPLGLAAPYAWRLVQCIRVYMDTGARPQLFNALKYSTAFPVGGPACLAAGAAAQPPTAFRSGLCLPHVPAGAAAAAPRAAVLVRRM